MGAMKEPAASLYGADYYAWVHDQAAALRRGDFARLDLAHLIDEVESLGRSEERELASRLARLLVDLLRWQCQPSRQSRSWLGTIRVQRRAIETLFRRMPSLRPQASEVMADAYGDALTLFHRETGLGIEDLPEACPYTARQVLTSDWLPAA